MKAIKLTKKGFLQIFAIFLLISLSIIPKDKIINKKPAINAIDISINQDAVVKPSTVIDDSEGRLVVDASNFVDLLSQIHYSLDEYQGTELELEGFVEGRKGLQQQYFYISRTVISCCVEDAENMGILSYWDGEAPPENTWLKVKGVLQAIENQNPKTGGVATVPILIIIELEEIEKPNNPFIEL